ncbi:hypothetical protein [Chondromyces apiculatus]|uniref:Uncharacterized protein n=1 Tax=Chondromyces apiculatus DSM 436 TaxID=1192034 RepID=A0A017TEN8_9BACT|nr:hypothetical protein [Chondromyces apiculatus]EYF07763.1 Hypothetical protein CAP_7712 [Chondromyces apiculatus DSM 436]
MGIELTAEQQAVLVQTRAVDTTAEFEALLATVRTEMNQVVQEVMAPSQAIDDTLIELRDLYLTAVQHAVVLEGVGYTEARLEAFRTGLRLLDTAHLWFGEGARTGAFRALNVAKLVAASRPFRARLKAYAAQAFVFEPDIAARFADVNSSRTVEEEIADLRMLMGEARSRQEQLSAVGVTEAFLVEGEALLDNAEKRDLLGVLGIRQHDDAITLRNAILTYTILLGREARAAGVNACFGKAEVRVRFEGLSFRKALRRLRPKTRPAAASGEGPEKPVPDKPTTPTGPSKPTTPAPTTTSGNATTTGSPTKATVSVTAPAVIEVAEAPPASAPG